MHTHDCLCVADMCVDLVLRGNVRPQFHQVEQLVESYQLELGGSANIFATQYARLGGRAGVIGYVGQDDFGALVLRRLQSFGVDTSRVQVHHALPTGLGVALVDAERDDRAILTVPGTIDAVTPADLTPDLLSACQHWHIASFFLLGQLRPCWRDWLQRCRACGVSTSLDTNWDPDNQWRGVTNMLPWVDVFLPNEAEALAITGAADVERAGHILSRRCRVAVIKCGARGAWAFSQDQSWRHTPDAQRGLHIVDTIGAGDCFDAGFVRAWQLGKPMDECLAWGARCAEASLSAAGGIAGQLRAAIT